MVEPLRKLNKICQKADYKTKGNWYVRMVVREAALPATWLLLHTSVTANQVTLISLAVSMVAMVFLVLPGAGAFLAGALLLQLWYYLDHVDGQIARYRKTASLTGRFLDFLTHHIVHTALFFALGFYALWITRAAVFALWGFVSALSILVFNLVHDVKYKTFFEKIDGERLQGTVALKKSESGHSVSSKEPVSFVKRCFSLAHKLCEIHVMMNILTIAALLEAFVWRLDLRFFLFIVYGVLAPVLAAVKVAHILKYQQIDREYNDTFHASA